MSLVIKETIRREAYTVIDGKNVVFHSMEISTVNPENFQLRDSVLDKELYKEHRAVCRQNIADFEDSAYALIDEMISKSTAEVEAE